MTTFPKSQEAQLNPIYMLTLILLSQSVGSIGKVAQKNDGRGLNW